jgi:hypothetical protein
VKKQTVRISEIKAAVGAAVDALTPRPHESLVGFALLDAAAYLHARVARATCDDEEGAALLRTAALETFAELYDLAVKEVENENPFRKLR